MKKLASIFATLVLLAGAAAAETGGTVAIQTLNIKVFNAVNTAQISSPLQNIGQAQHLLTYCPNSSVSALQIFLEASYDGISWFQITPTGGAGPQLTCYTLEAGGYYPYVRVHLLNITPSGLGGNVTAFYSASDAPIPASTLAALPLRAFASAFEAHAVPSIASSYFASVSSTNPGAGVAVLTVNSPSSSVVKVTYFKRAYVSCSAACKIAVKLVGNQGTCTAGTAFNTINQQAVLLALSTVGTACTVAPSANSTFLIYSLAANTGQEIDLEGLSAGTAGLAAGGLDIVNVSSLTGELDATVEWYEQ